MQGPRFSSKEMIARLVAFDTTSRSSNLPLIDFVSDYLGAYGVQLVRVPSPDGSKANLYATLGPKAPGGIVLSGHTDVVPVDGQDWQSDPWTLTEKDGRLYGRGTADMKSFSAIALALVPEFLARGLRTPLHFALSYDEEVGCIGVRPLIARITERFARPRLVIVGEPTGMQVVTAHKGIRAFITTVRGHEVHSSQTHKGVNAIAVAAELIRFLGELAKKQEKIGDATGRFEPPYTSIHVGMIEGGTALNIVPRHCRFLWEFRPLPGADEEAIIGAFRNFAEHKVLPRLKAVSPEADIVIEEGHSIPSFIASAESPAVPVALSLAGQNETHAVSFGTEAGLFEAGGLPAVICGPGDIAQAHQPNEFIALAQVEACERFFRRLMDEICVN
jgi:acetylornithine deacetylase